MGWYNKTSMSGKKQTRLNESGMVSFMVTMIMMIVITLIVLGFSQVVRRNQREALDRQLSAQAFYAAESGVNDATKTINATLKLGNPLTPKTTCAADGVYVTGNSNVLDAGSGTAYTCLMVAPFPDNLVLSNLDQNSSTVVPVNYADSTGAAQNAKTMTFSWTVDPAGTKVYTDCNDAAFTWRQVSSWICGYAMLRVDLMQVPATSNSFAALNNASKTFFFAPWNVDNNPNYDYTFKAGITRADCATDTTQCTVTVNFGAPGPAGTSKYYVRLTPLYRSIPQLTINGTVASGAAADFANSQILINSTGKAQDTLRRIQVRLPVGNTNNTQPSYAVQSNDSVCKKFGAATGVFIDYCP